MEDILPNANISILESHKDFFFKIGEIAISEHGMKTALRNAYSRNEILEVHQDNNKIFAQLIYSPRLEKNIEVEMKGWKVGDHPSYCEYVENIRRIVGSILKSYNKRYSSRFRITIQTQESTQPTLPPKAHKAFESFVKLSNKEVLHECDWKRFYYFVKVVHRYRIKKTSQDILRLLLNSGYPQSLADELSSLFDHLQKFQRTILNSYPE